MEYSELVETIVLDVLEACNVVTKDGADEKIKVGHDAYNFSSLDPKVDREELKKRIATQNEKIDNETDEEKANRTAQFKKAHNI